MTQLYFTFLLAASSHVLIRHGPVVELQRGLLHLLVGEPEADVPSHEPAEAGVETLVEGEEALTAPRLDSAVQGPAVLAGRAVHKPGTNNVNKSVLYCFKAHCLPGLDDVDGRCDERGL